MLRRTKIIATLGPSTDDVKVVDLMIKAGVDLVRLNCAYESAEMNRQRAEMIRKRARSFSRPIGLIVDLQGPNVCITSFEKDCAVLTKGTDFTLDTKLAENAGNESTVGLWYKKLPQDIKRGDNLLLDGGRIKLWVDTVSDTKILCKVAVGGELRNNQKINRQGGGLSARPLTDEDKQNIQLAAEINADYITVSSPLNAEDITNARQVIQGSGSHASIIAKIERKEALDCLEEIIDVADAILISRGDLGVEVGYAKLPEIQKDIIRIARKMNKIVITASEMIESMVTNAIPKRSEVFDVANAVLDGTDAVMLSEETAQGNHPDLVIEAVEQICVQTEKQKGARVSDHRLDCNFSAIDESIAMAAMYTANHLNIKAIASLTESGKTPLWMSRISSGIPIYAMTRHVATRRKVTLYRGVTPVSFDASVFDRTDINRETVDELVRRGALREGDLMLITNGDMSGTHGATNVMQIVRVGDSSTFNY
jgi:pyruvate kinase